MISPPSALASAIDVDWTVQESCVISWKNELDNSEDQLLGKPCSITLWIGSRVSDNSRVALLQVTIKSKFSGRAKFFDFFLFVDPHQIQLDGVNEPVIRKSSILTFLAFAVENIKTIRLCLVATLDYANFIQRRRVFSLCSLRPFPYHPQKDGSVLLFNQRPWATHLCKF